MDDMDELDYMEQMKSMWQKTPKKPIAVLFIVGRPQKIPSQFPLHPSDP